jgi:hypothetical protein
LLNEIEFPTYKKQMPGSFRPVLLKKDYTLAPNECQTLVFSSEEYKKLNIEHPYLWYPLGYGEQYLHHLSIRSYVSVICPTSRSLISVCAKSRLHFIG